MKINLFILMLHNLGLIGVKYRMLAGLFLLDFIKMESSRIVRLMMREILKCCSFILNGVFGLVKFKSYI